MRWSGLTPLHLDEIHHRLGNLLGRLTPSQQPLIGWSPDFDLFECDDQIVVRFDLPGICKDDVNISVTGDMLTILGERKIEPKIKDYLAYRECPHGRFRRSIPLHHGVDADKIRASYHNGVLEIVLPQKEGVKPRGIKVSIE
jgi:HSP20 family protein